ncbi:hypothetical protein ANRL4_03353 [Anaerolineae bacterium]|nr:hypothetical protein ANRL4_03353 [Anaerolineae bacterium]
MDFRINASQRLSRTVRALVWVVALSLITGLAPWMTIDRAVIRAQDNLQASTIVATSLRVGAGRDYAIIMTLPEKTALILEARDDEAQWVLVHTLTQPSQRGWIQIEGITPDHKPEAASLAVSSELVITSAPPNAFARYAAQITPENESLLRSLVEQGRANGLNPTFFTKVGDCNVGEDWFLDFYKNGRGFNLGIHTRLQRVLDYYAVDSFLPKSEAQEGGFSTANILDPTWADPAVCTSSESPLACELRVSRPALVIIQVGFIDATHGVGVTQYTKNLNLIVDQVMETGAIPILATNPVNLNVADHARALNNSIRVTAQKRGLPLIDLATAVDLLPNHGMTRDGKHLNPADYFVRADFRQFMDGLTIWNYLAMESLYNMLPLLESAP